MRLGLWVGQISITATGVTFSWNLDVTDWWAVKDSSPRRKTNWLTQKCWQHRAWLGLNSKLLGRASGKRIGGCKNSICIYQLFLLIVGSNAPLPLFFDHAKDHCSGKFSEPSHKAYCPIWKSRSKTLFMISIVCGVKKLSLLLFTLSCPVSNVFWDGHGCLPSIEGSTSLTCNPSTELVRLKGGQFRSCPIPYQLCVSSLTHWRDNWTIIPSLLILRHSPTP